MSVYRRKSGKYQVLVDLEPGTNGARRRRSLGTYTTKREAEAAERLALTDRDHGIDVDPKRLTVGELIACYIRDGAVDRAPKTTSRYEEILRDYFEPYALAATLVSKLKPGQIAAWQTELRSKGGRRRPSLAPKTVRDARNLGNASYCWGITMQHVHANPFKHVKRPVVPRSIVRHFHEDERMKILAEAHKGRWGPFVTLAFALGARRGELCALSWKDVDWHGGTIRIERSLTQYTLGRSNENGGPKTESHVEMKSTKTDDVRVIPLSSLAFAALRKARVMQAEDRLRLGSAYVGNDHDLIFTDELGHRHKPANATAAFARIAGRAGVAVKRLHSTRHTAATLMLTSGIDVVTAAGILGHRNPTQTLSTYGHVVAGAKREAVDRLAEALEKVSGDG